MSAAVCYASSTRPAPPSPELIALSLAAFPPIPAAPRVPVVRSTPAPAMTYERALTECGGLLHYHARRTVAHLELDDALQTGRLALLIAVRSFRPEDGRAFSAFASTVIRNRLLDAVRVARRRGMSGVMDRTQGGCAMRPVELYPIDADDAAPALGVAAGQEDAYAAAEERARFASLVATLPARDRAIIAGYIAGATHEELAERFGVSRVWIGQIARGAVAKLALLAREDEAERPVPYRLTGADMVADNGEDLDAPIGLTLGDGGRPIGAAQENRHITKHAAQSAGFAGDRGVRELEREPGALRGNPRRVIG
jgi:RNA polymerase sigma factor (sigma-70 family)